ncbi:MAG: alpha/beta hydrolase [Oligoflexia bacterium]|nr:alpha/beta hydrolase [Oligoflexia bacterium]
MKTVKVICKICLCWTLFFPFIAGALKESHLSVLYELLKEEEFYTVGSFKGANQTLLGYGKFGKGRGKNGSLIFVNGKGESLFRYMELFYDFYLQGWSPIYTYDHRNQGFSRPVSLPVSFSQSGEIKISNSSKVSYEENYTLYRKDLEAFISFILKDRDVDRFNLFLIAHSKGGAVVLDYLQTYPDSPFKSAVLSAPMIKYNSNLFFFLERGAFFLLNGYCSLMSCQWKTPSFRSRLTYKTFTGSKARYAFSEFVEKRQFPQSAPKGTSFRWLLESRKITDRLMDQKRIQRIKTPLMFLQAEKDYFVLNEYQNVFCEKIPDCCRIEKIPGKHEIFMEKDELRDEALNRVMLFFLSSETYQKQCQQPL